MLKPTQSESNRVKRPKTSVNLLTLLGSTHRGSRRNRATGLEPIGVCTRLHTRGVPPVSVHISLEGKGRPQQAPGVSSDGQAAGPEHLGHTWDRPSHISPWAMQPASPIRSLTSTKAPYQEPASPSMDKALDLLLQDPEEHHRSQRQEGQSEPKAALAGPGSEGTARRPAAP